jgi:glycosyltransferase involved in cell wall biosynthesis
MPVYNAAQWLANAIADWQHQSRPDFRLYISDNASTDDSFEICRELASKDPRISVHRNAHNIGICGNFRRVLELGADSDYFMWSSSHDHFDPRTLELCVATLDGRRDAVLCGGRARLFEEHLEAGVDDDPVPDLEDESPVKRFRSVMFNLKINNLVHGLIRTKALLRTRAIEDYYSSDNVLVAHLALMGKLVQLSETLFYRRMDHATATRRMSDSELRQYWDPDNRGVASLTQWKIGRGLGRAVRDTPLPFAEKLSAFRFVLRSVYWARGVLLAELLQAARQNSRLKRGAAS